MHQTDGELRAYLDGEVEPDAAERIRGHLETCLPCEERLSALEWTEAVTSEAVAAIDPEVDADAARERVRDRLRREEEGDVGATVDSDPRPQRVADGATPIDAARSARERRGRSWGALARAAILVLALAGGASAALPGSPVRGWLEGAWQRIGGGSAETYTAESATGDASESAVTAAGDETGVRVEPSAGSVRIELLGLTSGDRIRVHLTDATGAGVFAGSGTDFRTGPGSVQARVRGDEVRVEVPRGASRATLSVNGEVFFRKDGERVEVPGPVSDSADSEFRFRLP